MKFTKYALIALISLGMISCGSSSDGEDPDTQDPSINISAPTANQSFTEGTTINASFTASDNKALKEYVINVVFFQTVGMIVKNAPVPYEFDDSGNLSGLSQTVPINLEIPTNTKKGKYKMTVTVRDAAIEVNETTEERTFIIE